MKEEYLHYLFDTRQLGIDFQTVDNKKLEIIDFGELNTNAGPDFLDAKIKYQDTIWAGPIEFHVRGSDWYKHRHHMDPTYGNVIAHFVLTNDQRVVSNGFELPTVELANQVDWKHYKKYLNVIGSKEMIPCATKLGDVGEIVIEEQKEICIDQRLWRKALIIVRDLERSKGDRRKTWHLAIARSFAGKVNALPFEMTIDRMNINWLARLNYDPFRTEALLLGMAGLLPDESNEEYVRNLITEFEFQQLLFGINEIKGLGWKYSRMRPFGFPDIRLVQFAAFLLDGCKMAEVFKEEWKPTDFYEMTKLEPDSYWKCHFRIGNETQPKSSHLSKSMVDLILINAVIPFIYAIGLWEGNETLRVKAKRHLKQIRPEKNMLISSWINNGVSVENAFDSQSLLELKKEGCNRKKCLFCRIGKSILKR